MLKQILILTLVYILTSCAQDKELSQKEEKSKKNQWRQPEENWVNSN